MLIIYLPKVIVVHAHLLLYGYHFQLCPGIKQIKKKHDLVDTLEWIT